MAEMLGVTPNTVSRWAREGKLPSVATLGGHRRYEVDVVEELLKGRLVTPPSEGPDEDS